MNRQYISLVKISNSKQLNKIILMQEVSSEFALSIAIQRAKNQEKSEDEIQNIIDEHEDLKNNNEMKKMAVAVYIKDEMVCYCYGEISQIYKKLVEFIYKIASVKLNRNGISIFLYLYIINKFKLDITDKWVEVSEFINESVEIHEAPGKISKAKILFSKYKTRINIKKSELEKDEIPINNYITMNMKVNGETVIYRLGKKKLRLKEWVEYYFPIKSMYNDEYAMHIRRDKNSNLVLVKRLKEPIENTLKFKILESNFLSFLFYHLGRFLKKEDLKRLISFMKNLLEKLKREYLIFV